MKSIITFLFLSSMTTQAQQTFEINGKVSSDTDAIPFATVLLENTSKGMIADADGNFSIKDVAPGSYTLVASFVGYRSQKKKIIINNADQLQFG